MMGGTDPLCTRWDIKDKRERERKRASINVHYVHICIITNCWAAVNVSGLLLSQWSGSVVWFRVVTYLNVLLWFSSLRRLSPSDCRGDPPPNCQCTAKCERQVQRMAVWGNEWHWLPLSVGLAGLCISIVLAFSCISWNVPFKRGGF